MVVYERAIFSHFQSVQLIEEIYDARYAHDLVEAKTDDDVAKVAVIFTCVISL